MDGDNWNSSNGQSCSPSTSQSQTCREITFRDVQFLGNTATKAGGGVFVSNPNYVTCTCDKENLEIATLTDVVQHHGPLSNFQNTSESLCTVFHDNMVEENEQSYGPLVATNAFHLELEFPKTPFREINSGERLLRNDTEDGKNGTVLLVKDAFSQTIRGGRPEARLEVDVISPRVAGRTRYNAYRGRIEINETLVLQEEGEEDNMTVHNITIRSTRLADLAYETNFTFRLCYPGEEKVSVTCTPCPSRHFSFDGGPRCLPCPDHGICDGGPILIPEDGYWHSTPFSPFFHKCLVDDACEYKNRSDKLKEFYSDPSNLHLSKHLVDNSIYRQCDEVSLTIFPL